MKKYGKPKKRKAKKFLKNKKSSEIDTPEVRYIKGLIRKGEARATCHFIGIPDAQIHLQLLRPRNFDQ